MKAATNCTFEHYLLDAFRLIDLNRPFKAIILTDIGLALLSIFGRIRGTMESTPGRLPNRRVIELMHEFVCSQFSYWHAKLDRLWYRWCAKQSGLDYQRSELDIEDNEYDSVAPS